MQLPTPDALARCLARRLDARARTIARAGFTAVAEALYPINDLGAPDWRDADMVARADRWLDALPPAPRALVIVAFAAVELGAPVLAPGSRRLSRLPPERRAALIRRWRVSPIPSLKLVGEALKQATTMIYLSHPAVHAHLGVDASGMAPEQGP